MPIGYLVNNRYAIDHKYDRYADLPVFKRITAEVSKQGYGCFVKFTPVTRGYICEIRKFESKFRSQTSEHIYYFTEGHKYGDNPLEACCAAIRQCVPMTPLLAVLILEAECVLLGMALKDRKAIEQRLERTLDELAGVLDDVLISAMPKRTIIATVEAFSAENLTNAFFGSSKPDLDDDL